MLVETKYIFKICQQSKATFFNFFKNKVTDNKNQPPKKDEWDKNNWMQMGNLLQKIRKENTNKPKVLPLQTNKHQGKLTVVCELDEVLIYTFAPDPRENWMTAPLRKSDYSVDLPEFDTWIDIYKRENFNQFLNYWITETEPVVWSCGHPSYVKKVMSLLCPEFPQQHILTQENCNLVEEPDENLELFVKDINLLGRDLSRVVYVDSKPLNFWGTGDNSLPITVFTADNTDEHNQNDLLQLIEELQFLQKQPNVKETLSQRYKVEEIQRESKLIL